MVDPVSKACINTVESMCSQLRASLHNFGVRQFYLVDSLAYWMVRRKDLITFEQLVDRVLHYTSDTPDADEPEEDYVDVLDLQARMNLWIATDH
ncbi:hypothetical protein BLNAU_7479 [Blattamonas nauphoetae]|uniref:Uncharacterized protein n=1 Tax=Blattamonas nauphoetae TaxID=2049346 RepID=A0ABQ9Y1H5_9EUKA|nr:hypothetical protein BLNAU_7479 [Blattamonas nauphoetae]